jgi:hypothetical protein
MAILAKRKAFEWLAELPFERMKRFSGCILTGTFELSSKFAQGLTLPAEGFGSRAWSFFLARKSILGCIEF